MAIEAPPSRYKRSNFKIWMALLIGLSIIFAYDGYLSQYPWSQRRSFYEEHMRVHLFDTQTSLTEHLDQGPASPELLRTFQEVGVPLSEDATVSVRQPDLKWEVDDRGRAYTYFIVKEETGLAVYRVEPDGVMLFNMISPVVFIAIAVLWSVLYWRSKDDKVVAEETELIIAGKERIPYDAIEKIDKTHYDRKGHFTIIYRSKGGPEARCTLRDRQYDNLGAILDHLISQIT